MFNHCTSIFRSVWKQKKNTLYSIICLISLPGLAFGKGAIVVAPGSQETISAKGAARATVSDLTIATADTITSEDQIVITGLTVGSTDMTVWLENGKKDFYQIKVSEKGVNTFKEVKAMLSGIEGLKITNSNSEVVVSGQVYRGDDMVTLQRVLKMYPNVKNFTQVNPQALEYFQQTMLGKLRQEDFNQIQVSKDDDTLYLEGYVRNSVEKKRAEKIAKNVYIRTESHLEIGIDKKNLILVDLKFMEIKKDSLNHLGITWPQNVDVSSTVSLAQSAFSSVLSTTNTIQLNGLIQKGDAKVLSNPKLLCQSGTPASFDAGGEIPIRLTSERTASVFFKPYGLHLDIKAKSDAGQRASVEIQSRMSDLDMATAIDGIPGILEHKVNTAVNLDFGQTASIAGLIESRNSKNVSKVPVLGHIPVLGELFKSRNFRNNLSEFVLFLTPILANGDSPYHQQQKNMSDQKMKQTDDRIKFHLLD